MTFNGAPSVNLTGCSLQSNTSATCNGHNGGAFATYAVGTAGAGCSNPQSGANAVPDTYAELASNISRVCSGLSSTTWAAGALLPILPGMMAVGRTGYVEYHVCGDLTLSGTGDLNGPNPLIDMVIVVENGTITFANDASITAKRVTFVLTGANSSNHQIVFPNGNGHGATLSLTPSINSANPWHGIGIYQDPALTANIDMDWGPGATANVDGVMYFPKANVTMRGNAASNSSARGGGCTKFVTGTFTTNGNVGLDFVQTSADCARLNVSQYTAPVRLAR